MRITICDVCGKLFEETQSSKCTIGYTDYEICETCQGRIEKSMITKTNDYLDKVDRKLFEVRQWIENGKKEEAKENDQ